MYDGCKILLLESMDREMPINLEALGTYAMQKVVIPVIAMEYFNTASADGSIKSGILKPFSAKPENGHVIMDFSKLNIVWAKDMDKDDIAALKIEEAFLAPIWNKVTSMREAYIKEQEDALNEKVSDKVKELIGQATGMDPVAFKQKVDALEKSGGLLNNTAPNNTAPNNTAPNNTAPNTPHVAMPQSSMMGLPGVSTPHMELGNFNE